MESTEMTLYHYGVKGMKWGVRKKRFTPIQNIRRAGGMKTMRRDAKAALAKEKASMTPAQKKKLRRLKTGIAATVVVGSAAVAAATAAIGTRRVSQMARQAAIGAYVLKRYNVFEQTGPLSFKIEDRYTPFGNILGL